MSALAGLGAAVLPPWMGRAEDEKPPEKPGTNIADALKYPHEFSGGQRQRIAIARALALRPRFIILDEPVSAIDVVSQVQILAMLRDLKQEYGLSYILISHDLGVVNDLSDSIAVMYLGVIVEMAATPEFFSNVLHPYSQALLSAAPVPDPRRKKQRVILSGDVPSPIAPPPGCRFHTRCIYTREACRTQEPMLREVKQGHFAACLFAEEIQGKGAV